MILVVTSDGSPDHLRALMAAGADDWCLAPQDVVEAVAGSATLKVNGSPVSLLVPPVGISGGAAAVAALTGLYTR